MLPCLLYASGIPDRPTILISKDPGALPHLRTEVVTFPQPRTSYADISVPTIPDQMLERIGEIEHVIYQAGIVPLDQISFGAVCRTYAFFEASVWLVDQYPPSYLVD